MTRSNQVLPGLSILQPPFTSTWRRFSEYGDARSETITLDWPSLSLVCSPTRLTRFFDCSLGRNQHPKLALLDRLCLLIYCTLTTRFLVLAACADDFWKYFLLSLSTTRSSSVFIVSSAHTTSLRQNPSVITTFTRTHLHLKARHGQESLRTFSV